jgi:hypothetical protein
MSHDEAMQDLVSHRRAWRSALEACQKQEKSVEDNGYWTHELAVFDRVFDALTQGA